MASIYLLYTHVFYCSIRKGGEEKACLIILTLKVAIYTRLSLNYDYTELHCSKIFIGLSVSAVSEYVTAYTILFCFDGPHSIPPYPTLRRN